MVIKRIDMRVDDWMQWRWWRTTCYISFHDPLLTYFPHSLHLLQTLLNKLLLRLLFPASTLQHFLLACVCYYISNNHSTSISITQFSVYFFKLTLAFSLSPTQHQTPFKEKIQLFPHSSTLVAGFLRVYFISTFSSPAPPLTSIVVALRSGQWMFLHSAGKRKE